MNSSTDDLIAVGYVRRAHGIKGDVVVRPQTDDPDRFQLGRVLTTGEEPRRDLTIVTVRQHAGDVIIGFDGLRHRDEAERLKGVVLHVPAQERRTLETHEYWPDDLVGCEVVDGDGRVLGTVGDVTVGAAQDRLVVVSGSTVLGEVPFVQALVHDVDVTARRIVVDLPMGLLEDPA